MLLQLSTRRGHRADSPSRTPLACLASALCAQELADFRAALEKEHAALPAGQETLPAAVVAKLGIAALAKSDKMNGWAGELRVATEAWKCAENHRLLLRQVDDEIRSVNSLVSSAKDMVYVRQGRTRARAVREGEWRMVAHAHALSMSSLVVVRVCLALCCRPSPQHCRIEEAMAKVHQAKEQVAAMKAREGFLGLPVVSEFFSKYEENLDAVEVSINKWQLDRATSDAARKLNGLLGQMNDLFSHYRNDEVREEQQGGPGGAELDSRGSLDSTVLLLVVAACAWCVSSGSRRPLPGEGVPRRGPGRVGVEGGGRDQDGHPRGRGEDPGFRGPVQGARRQASLRGQDPRVLVGAPDRQGHAGPPPTRRTYSADTPPAEQARAAAELATNLSCACASWWTSSPSVGLPGRSAEGEGPDRRAEGRSHALVDARVGRVAVEVR